METYADYGEVAELILDMDPIFFSTHWFVADLFWSDTQEGKQFLKDLSNEENQ